MVEAEDVIHSGVRIHLVVDGVGEGRVLGVEAVPFSKVPILEVPVAEVDDWMLRDIDVFVKCRTFRLE